MSEEITFSPEARAKLVHYGLAREHFSHAVHAAPHGCKAHLNALVAHHHMVENEPALAQHIVKAALKRSSEIVNDKADVIADKHPRVHGNQEASREASKRVAREHLRLGAHHANHAGLAGGKSPIPAPGHKWQ